MYIIPDEVLNQLLCSVCFKYLSVKPVKIYKNKVFTIKCGRCSKENDDGVVSLYGTIIGNGLFPCINRYEGCTQLLNYSEVAIHEEECKSGYYPCLICGTEFSSYHLVRHYQKDHPEAILEKPELLLTNEKEFKKYYMYKENDFIYILFVGWYLSDDYFHVNSSCVGPSEIINNIKYYVKCYLGDTVNPNKLFLKTKQKSIVDEESFKLPMKSNSIITISFVFNKTAVNVLNYERNNQIRTSVNNRSTATTFVGLHELTKIHLNERFKRKFHNVWLNAQSQLVKTTKDRNGHTESYCIPRSCIFCKNDFSLSESNLIFTCSGSEGHVYCHTCYCIKPFCYQHDSIIKLELDNSNTEIYRLLQFYCNWNCGLSFSSLDLGYHVDHCKKSIYKPISSANSFNLCEINENTHLISRSNLFSFEKYGFQNGEKIFVITRNNFKFVLHSSYMNNVFHFWISHDYPEDYYHNIQFKIRDKFIDPILPHINTLTLQNHNDQVIKNIWGFAVVLNIK